MSLRWKLFRFLSVETVLDSSAGRENADAFGETTLFPALSAEHNQERASQQRVLRRFATASERAVACDAVDGIYVVALPRGVVQLFHLALVDPALTLAPPASLVLGAPPLHYTFSAHEGAVLALVLVRHGGEKLPSLVTLGVDDGNPCVKVWEFKVRDVAKAPATFHSPNTDELPSSPLRRRLSGRDGNRFECIAVYRLQGDSRPRVLAVKDAKVGAHDIAQVAVGFEDGSVTILSGDVVHERASRVRIAPAPGEMNEVKPIVFACFCGSILYCVSEMSVVAIIPALSGVQDTKAPAFRREILGNLGSSSRNLCTTIENSAELIIAKEEALYFFNRDGLGPCIAFATKGDKARIASAGNYLIHSTGPGSITVYDVVNKLIAYRGKGTVSCSFKGYGPDARNFLLCFTDGTVLRLSEISLEQRVNLLLKRGLYVPAVSLARAESTKGIQDPDSMLTRALRQYAEYLMSKDRYDEAAEQLVETIGGNVEPSWVITCLVEQSGLRSGLRLYLEALHAKGHAAFVHTKVLITCYRHDRARGAILGSKAIEKTTDEYVINVFSDLDWTEDQVDAAIVLCRDAGLFKVAERVSRRRGRYEQLARTLVEDLGETEKALALLRSLQDIEALTVIQACGRQLLVKDPVNFVHYLSDAICRSTSMMPVGRTEPILQLSIFLPIFIDMPRWRAVLLERILGTTGGITNPEAPRAWLLLFESLVSVDVGDHVRAEKKISLNAKTHDDQGHPDLDGLGDVNIEKADDQQSTASESSIDHRERRPMGRRALKILQSRRSVIDLRTALEIAEQYGHDPCLEYLYEHLRLYKELGICLRRSENGASLLRACRRHGEREPRLWMECIRLYVPLAGREGYGSAREGGDAGEKVDMVPAISPRRPSSLLLSVEHVAEDGSVRGVLNSLSEAESERSSAQDVVDEALVALDRSGLLSPVEIVELVVNACPSAAWGVVREYFERCTTGLRREAAVSEHAGMLLESEVGELRREAKRVGEETVVVKPKTCASCEDAVSVPAVHFFCEHSFHVSCLAPGGGTGGGGGGSSGSAAYLVVGGGGSSGLMEEAKGGMWAEECPRCAPALDAMVSMRQALQDKNGRHDEFFSTLKNSRDGFSTIVEFLERSPFI